MTLNNIGLNIERTEATVKSLNTLLADYQFFYMKLRGFHWNIKGKSFFELHLKFEELYNNVNLKVDEIAERILALEGSPLHSFTAYQKVSSIKELTGVNNGEEMIQYILSDFKLLIMQQRDILGMAAENNDEGTNSLMADYITEQEKTVWMLKAYLT